MPAQIVLLIPLGEMPPSSVDNTLPGLPPSVGVPGFPGQLPMPGGPVDPGWGQGHPRPPHVGGGPITQPPQVGGGPIMPPGVDNTLPPNVAPPIALPTPPGQPPTIWPPAGTVQPPMVQPPAGVWPPPKPAPGYIVVWVPGYGMSYVKLGVEVGGGPVPPAAQPKA